MGLTEEQKKRIEENRMKALAKRQENQSTTNVTASASLPKKPSVPVPTTTTKQGMSASLATVSLASIAIYQNKAPVTSQINKPSTTGEQWFNSKLNSHYRWNMFGIYGIITPLQFCTGNKFCSTVTN